MVIVSVKVVGVCCVRKCCVLIRARVQFWLGFGFVSIPPTSLHAWVSFRALQITDYILQIGSTKGAPGWSHLGSMGFTGSCP
jgi:hypothetical protein